MLDLMFRSCGILLGAIITALWLMTPTAWVVAGVTATTWLLTCLSIHLTHPRPGGTP